MMYPNAPAHAAPPAYFGATPPMFGANPSSPGMATYERLFLRNRASKSGRVSLLSLRGRRLVEKLKSLRRSRVRKSSELEAARSRVPDAEGLLERRKERSEDARKAYRTTANNPFASNRAIRRKSRAWSQAQDRVEEAQQALSDLRTNIAHLSEEVERIRSDIRDHRSKIADVARELKSELARDHASKGEITAAKAEADDAVIVAVDVSKEQGESQVHDARANIAAMARELQEAILQFEDLQARYASAVAKAEAKGDEVTDQDRATILSLQSELMMAGMRVINKMMAMSLIDLSPLSMAESEEEESVSFAVLSDNVMKVSGFGLIPNWAYDYDLTSQFGNAGAGASAGAGPAAGGGGNPAEAMGWINAIGNMTGQVMTGIGSIIGAVGTNQNLTPQQQQNLQNTQQGMYNTGQVLTGQQPQQPQTNWGPQPQPQPQQPYYPPPQATPSQNWMPWAFGSVAVLGLGALAWAILSN